ncbi:MAG: serine/threonine-protein phosphatase [Anaerolineae bacterium]|nr:serine/threonine-protein phosphatase [Anaerolineae bacterium]
MGFINFFARIFYSFRNLLAGPGRLIAGLRYRISAPFRLFGSLFRQLKMVRPSRFLRIPGPIRNNLERIPGVGKLFKRKEGADDDDAVDDLDIPDVDGQPFRANQIKAEYSQIHLIDLNSNRRYVTHIGTDIGRSEAQLKLGAHELYFLRVNPKLYDAPLLLQAKSEARVQIDGNELLPDIEDSLTVKIGSIITVNKVDYRVELFAWDVLPKHTRVKAAWKTHVGPLHNHNEDAIGIYQHAAGYMFVLSDGVGGVEGGEIASEFAVNYMLAAFHENIRYGFDWHEVMEQAVQDINAMIRQQTSTSGAIANATLTAVVIQNWDAFVLHIGDSRLYHAGRDGFHRITIDHMQEVEQAGLMRGESVKRRVLTQAIGKNETIRPDKMLLRLQPGDRLLLTSDGIETIPNDELVPLIQQTDINDVPSKLMNLAYINDSTDNVSVIAIEVLGEGVTKDKWRAYPSHRVFAGFDPSMALNFDPSHDFRTRHPRRQARRVGCWLIIIAVLCGFFFFSQIASTNNANETNDERIATMVLVRLVFLR